MKIRKINEDLNIDLLDPVLKEQFDNFDYYIDEAENCINKINSILEDRHEYVPSYYLDIIDSIKDIRGYAKDLRSEITPKDEEI